MSPLIHPHTQMRKRPVRGTQTQFVTEISPTGTLSFLHLCIELDLQSLVTIPLLDIQTRHPTPA
jgi:hypothetical protein